ncbi:unnamed protein product [Nippostrongylus brasiliensis]|uniref:Uncharacterized protein n=1 Tax=Nippostrongylus brasiliensis TaxID=27835 RepID=A0A0N4YBF6_NIPBR|nr:unnamed protein product [Nippostrongylus brasiliensis]
MSTPRSIAWDFPPTDGRADFPTTRRQQDRSRPLPGKQAVPNDSFGSKCQSSDVREASTGAARTSRKHARTHTQYTTVT